MMRTRLVFAIISTIMEEVAIVVIALWGLPRININLPVWILPPIMLLWLWWSVYIFRKGTHALKKRQPIGMDDMVGTKGRAVDSLNPEGMVKIYGELWAARAADGDIEAGSDVTVVAQDRLKLIVSPAQASSPRR